MKKLSFKIFLLFLLPFTLTAQKIEYVCGEYAYPAGKDVTRRQAEQEALERAKIDAIGKMFGITVSEQTILHKKDENGVVSAGFSSFGGTEVNGEWIKDSSVIYHPPYFNDAGIAIYKVSVCGIAREILSAGVDFSAKLLKNGTESKFESSEFRNGDDIFLLFRTPAEGYLAVYLIDDGRKAFCMLPYLNIQTGKAVNVKADKDYVFFSKKDVAVTERQSVVEYTLTCDKSMEHNLIYIVFSTKEFTKANAAQANDGLPPELLLDDFLQWLEKNRMRDKNMQVVQRSLTIKK